MRTYLIALLGIVFLLAACGGEKDKGGTPSSETPRTVEKPVIEGGIVKAHIPPAWLTLENWEWFNRSPNRMSRVAGRMMSSDGRPVAGGTATLLIKPPVPMAPAFPAETVVADENGVFEFRDVPFNAWIRIEATGHGGWIFLAPELQMRGEKTKVALLRPAGEIRGVVRLADGEPVTDVEVMVSNQGPRFAKSVRTDENGRYVMTDVPEGTHSAWLMSNVYRGDAPEIAVKAGATVEADITAKKPAPITLKIVDARTGMALAGAVGSTLFMHETILAADENGILKIEGACFPRVWFRGRGYGEMLFDFPPERDVAMTRTVEMMPGGTARGRVVDEAGKPIAGARVEVIVEPAQPGLPIRGPLSAEDGSFEVSWIPVADREVPCAIVATWPDHHLESAAIATLKAGEAAEGLEVVLAKHRAAKLRVLGTDGEPVAWAVVGLKGLQPRQVGANPVFHSGSSGTTDSEGFVVVRGLAAGPIEVEIRASGHVPVTMQKEVTKEDLTDLGEFRLEEGMTLTGSVASSTGTLPEGAMIRISGGNIRDTIRLSGDGKFRYEGLPRGRIHLRVQAPGHEPVMRIVSAGDQDLSFVLRALSVLTVKIDRPEDALLNGWLEVRPLGGKVSERDSVIRPLRGKVDSYTFRNVVAGKYRVRIGAGDYYALAVVKVPQGESVTADLSFKVGSTIRGTILRPDGLPAKRVGVSYEAEGDWGRRGMQTSGSGQFEFRGVPPGEVRIETHPMGFTAVKTTVSVAKGGAADLKLMLKTGGRIYISVKDDAERPLPDIRISLTGSDGKPADSGWTAAARRRPAGTGRSSSRGSRRATTVSPSSVGTPASSGVRSP